MLVVKLELHSAVTGEVSQLGELRISNDGTGDRERGNYDIECETDERATAIGRIERYPRYSGDQYRNPWVLVHRALLAVFVQLLDNDR